MWINRMSHRSIVGVVLFLAMLLIAVGSSAASASSPSSGATERMVGSGRIGPPSLPHTAVPLATVPVLSTPLTPTDNWAGWIQTGTEGEFVTMYGRWIVPTLKDPGVSGTQEGDWVGIGGVGGSPLLQVGTLADTNGGSVPRYEAWYEIANTPSDTGFKQFPCEGCATKYLEVSAGNKVQALLYLDYPINSTTGMWRFQIVNLTTKEQATLPIEAPLSGNSVEAIHERMMRTLKPPVTYWAYAKTTGGPEFNCLTYGTASEGAGFDEWFGTRAPGGAFRRDYITPGTTEKQYRPEALAMPSDLNPGDAQNKFNVQDGNVVPGAPTTPDTAQECGF